MQPMHYTVLGMGRVQDQNRGGIPQPLPYCTLLAALIALFKLSFDSIIFIKSSHFILIPPALVVYNDPSQFRPLKEGNLGHNSL
jgi:hypothetical protein